MPFVTTSVQRKPIERKEIMVLKSIFALEVFKVRRK